MATIAAKNGKNFITVTVGGHGGLGVAIGPQMNMLIGNSRDRFRNLTTFWATFERLFGTLDGIRKSTVARSRLGFVRLRADAIVAG
jgi:hypothetical protein